MRSLATRLHTQFAIPVWGAFLWSSLFGLASLYWAAGGTVGISTLAQSIQDAAHDDDAAMLTMTWITGVLKIMGGLLALMAIRPIGDGRIRTVLLVLLWGVGALYTLYGLLGFIEKLLMALGILDVPSGLGEGAVIWYLLLWEPFWILGGVLFLLTALRFGRIARNP